MALRIVFDDSEFGEHLLRLTVMDTDGKLVCADEDVHFYLDQPPASSPLLPESVRRIATWCIVRRLMEIELKLYGEYAIDLSLDGQPPLRTTFYVYPPQDA